MRTLRTKLNEIMLLQCLIYLRFVLIYHTKFLNSRQIPTITQLCAPLKGRIVTLPISPALYGSHINLTIQIICSTQGQLWTPINCALNSRDHLNLRLGLEDNTFNTAHRHKIAHAIFAIWLCQKVGNIAIVANDILHIALYNIIKLATENLLREYSKHYRHNSTEQRPAHSATQFAPE